MSYERDSGERLASMSNERDSDEFCEGFQTTLLELLEVELAHLIL